MDNHKTPPLPVPSSTKTNVKPEPQSSPPSASSSLSHDMNRMPENPPRNGGLRRVHSEIISLPDEIIITFHRVSDDDTRAPTSAANNNVVANGPDQRHQQHSNSINGSTSINQEPLSDDSRKVMSAAKLAELAKADPKRARRIWANRQSAARSKERRNRYISELENRVEILQAEATSLSAKLNRLLRNIHDLAAQNNEMRLQLQVMHQQVQLQTALNNAMREEVEHLRILTGQVPNVPRKPASLRGGQQNNSNNQAMEPHLAVQQLQQLQIRSRNHQQQQPQPQNQAKQQQKKQDHKEEK